MSCNKKGARLANSILSLDDLKSRCFVDSATGCWIWRMSSSDGAARAWFVDPETGVGRVWTATRLAIRLATGSDPAGVVYRYQCRDQSCINPAHLRVGTRAEAGAYRASIDLNKGNPAIILANTKTGRAQSKLTLEQVRMIRASDEPGTTLGPKLGVTQSTISAIRLGKKWRDEAAANSSVFAWRPSA